MYNKEVNCQTMICAYIKYLFTDVYQIKQRSYYGPAQINKNLQGEFIPWAF